MSYRFWAVNYRRLQSAERSRRTRRKGLSFALSVMHRMGGFERTG
jgi:hypothetical protein